MFNIFINYLIDRIESTHSTFSDNPKLGREVDVPEGKTILQKNLDKLEERASKSCMKFNKDFQKNC